MKRLVLAAAAILAVTGVVSGQAASTSSGPYVGSWKAHMTRAALLDVGLVDPLAVGTWRLVLNRDGTYRTFWRIPPANGSGWWSGTYTATSKRIVFKNDTGCAFDGVVSNGAYKWSIRHGKLTLAVVGGDRCTGLEERLTFPPAWTRDHHR